MAKAKKSNSKKTGKESTQSGPTGDPLVDWANRLASSEPVSRVRLVCRPGRAGNWTIVPGATIHMAQAEGNKTNRNSLDGTMLEGQAARFRALAESHFQTLRTGLGVLTQRADYKLEALAWDEAQGEESSAWDTEVLTLHRSDLPGAEREFAEADQLRAGTSFFTGLSNQTVWERDQFMRQIHVTQKRSNRLHTEAGETYIAAAKMKAEADQVEADKVVRLAEISYQDRVQARRVRAWSDTSKFLFPTLDRLIDLTTTVITGKPTGTWRKPNNPPPDQPNTHAEHCAYAENKFEFVAPVLGDAGLSNEHIQMVYDALVAGAEGNPEPMCKIVQDNPLTGDMAAALAKRIAHNSGDEQLGASVRELLLTSQV